MRKERKGQRGCRREAGRRGGDDDRRVRGIARLKKKGKRTGGDERREDEGEEVTKGEVVMMIGEWEE